MRLIRPGFRKLHFIHLYLLLYFIVNILFLTDFPYVHSDEPWLSGLSRNMLFENNLSVTEPFFDTYLRYPHAIKLIFHIIQIIFIKSFGYHIFSFRLISLIFALGSLFVFYQLCRILLTSEPLALLTTIILSLDIQFVYASHFARQEIIILFILLLSAWFFLDHKQPHDHRKDLILGIIVGLSIGIHPNSFIIALTLGGMYLFLILHKKIKIKNLFVFIGIVAIFALLFIAISFIMDQNFIAHYTQAGATFKVNIGLLKKFQKIVPFYINLYWRKSLTYFLPNIQFQLLLFAFIYIMALIFFVKKYREVQWFGIHLSFIAVTLINLGIIVIGRYNVTSILFIFPFMYLLAVVFMIHFMSKKKLMMGILLVLTCVNTIMNIPIYDSSYNGYINEISTIVHADDIVLSNLNAEYYFDCGKLYDYRNLSYIKEQGVTFTQYIRARKIQYIIYYDEMDYIYENDPHYNGIYGDISTYYDEMQIFLQERCQEITRFTNPTYGTNISRLIDKKQWKVHLYIIKEDL
ncbi:MAG: ArnT family glycosyltransferase [Eubacteriales bacterium]